MRPTFPAIVLLAASSASLPAQNTTTALSAIKLLSKDEAKRIARIEARDGNPVPERWYILVQDPSEETGLHEFVVSGGRIVASRSLSQFAEGLKPEEVLGSEGVKVDSDRAVSVAQRYAAANSVVPATFNYELRKDADDGTPVWNVTCVDASGKPLGGVVLAATKGAVLSHSGFAVEPPPEKKQKVEPTGDEERDREPLRQTRKRYVVRSRGPEPARQPPVAEKPNLFQRLFGR